MSELYKISKVISITKLANGGTRHKTNRLELENEFILKNRNIYSEQNDLLKEAENPKDYDANFYLRLKHIQPIYKISDFLNYHFLNVQNKNLFLKHLEYEILGYFNPYKEQRRIDFINKWISEKKENETLPTQQTEKPKPEQETPKTFDELFYNIELVQPSIDILKEIEPPFIDTDYNYIGKLKGIICVWIDELQRQGIVKHYSDRKIFASLIPQKIKRFSIDESMFGKYQSKAENNYRTNIKTKVSKIKLSQNSQ